METVSQGVTLFQHPVTHHPENRCAIETLSRFTAKPHSSERHSSFLAAKAGNGCRNTTKYHLENSSRLEQPGVPAQHHLFAEYWQRASPQHPRDSFPARSPGQLPPDLCPDSEEIAVHYRPNPPGKSTAARQSFQAIRQTPYCGFASLHGGGDSRLMPAPNQEDRFSVILCPFLSVRDNIDSWIAWTHYPAMYNK